MDKFREDVKRRKVKCVWRNGRNNGRSQVAVTRGKISIGRVRIGPFERKSVHTETVDGRAGQKVIANWDFLANSNG